MHTRMVIGVYVSVYTTNCVRASQCACMCLYAACVHVRVRVSACCSDTCSHQGGKMMSSGEHKLVSIAPHKDYRRCAVTLLCLRVFAMFVFDPETQTEAQLHASQVDTWTEAVLFPADASDKKRSTQAHKHDDTRWLTDVLRKGLIEGAQVIPERLHNLNLPTQIRTDATVELFAGECSLEIVMLQGGWNSDHLRNGQDKSKNIPWTHYHQGNAGQQGMKTLSGFTAHDSYEVARNKHDVSELTGFLFGDVMHEARDSREAALASLRKLPLNTIHRAQREEALNPVVHLDQLLALLTYCERILLLNLPLLSDPALGEDALDWLEDWLKTLSATQQLKWNTHCKQIRQLQADFTGGQGVNERVMLAKVFQSVSHPHLNCMLASHGHPYCEHIQCTLSRHITSTVSASVFLCLSQPTSPLHPPSPLPFS